MDSLSIADGSTVVAGPIANRKEWFKERSDDFPIKRAGYPFVGSGTVTSKGKTVAHDFSRTAHVEDRPFFVPISKDGVTAALQKLDKQLEQTGRNNLLSKKSPVSWIGREVPPGNIGLINHGGLPKILTRPGRYPGFPLRNWWARAWCGTQGLSDTAIEFKGLTVVQVSQNQAAVVSDPQNHIFVIKNSGFVAYAVEGTYDVLAIVDQTHLSTSIKDTVTGAVLGWTHEVKMRSRVGAGGDQEYVVALFLNIPANNCAILQRGDDLELLPAGQHYITNPNVTLRGLYTLGENQLEMPTKDIFTRDQVPVGLRIYLKWQLVEPLKLTTHGYSTPYDALRDKTQSILTQIVAHLDYSSMVKQRSLGPDNLDDGTDPSSAFLDALRTRAMDEMHEAALEYGIVLKDLAVIDRQFKGEIASTMDKLTTRALEAQVEAANVDRENSNKVKQEEGSLAVARIKAQARNTQADSEAYSVIAAAKAEAERTKIEALAQAEAIRLTAKADAEAIRIKATADAEVVDQFAREMEMRRVEVSRIQAFGNKAVFVPSDGPGSQMGGAMAIGMAAAMGNGARK
ncbi:hypothetical protein PAXINDRAFT_172956 [Paxillus involutus ATCC 200175]|uniref:Band 7 domain-containing protein n=1 Tax=Paxillus involutus ATCC 200175 TaxID=664439 RepID=A0A0C9TLZ9_PAXIN|nr:hypothetical protein PAXINDRAFT_172956 [Paxillus involutus ATCC 200175]